jgi:hypothetical protein
MLLIMKYFTLSMNDTYLDFFFQMSDVSVALESLKISDNDDIPEFEESDGDFDDTASKLSGASSTKEVQSELLKMAMKKIQELENKIEELAAAGGSPLKRKKKDNEFRVSTWSSRITDSGFFKANGGNVFKNNGARMAYINILMEYYKTSDFSQYTFDDLFNKDEDGDYPTFQALLDARPVPHDFEGCNLVGKNKLTSNHVKVAVVPPPMAEMVAMD